MIPNLKKNVLLTGAGFTANFGGPLARQMWSKILNNPKIESLPEVKKILLKNFDFEQVYSDVSRSSVFPAETKELFQKIMVEAYSDMDETLKSYVHGGFNQYGSYWGAVSTFLALFNGTGNEIGIHFTLNQDILLERSRSGPVPLGITAVKYRTYWDSLFAGQIGTNDRITLYDDAGLEEFKTKHLGSVGSGYYVKLHGSHGWLSYTEREQMVIGKNKVEDIQHEPLLRWYSELFKEALDRDGVNLFVIGYSFRDQHINDCILHAVREHGLKLYIISPEDPEALKDRLEGKIPNGIYEVSENIKIWEAVQGYFPYKLAEIFPYDQSETQVAKHLKKLLGR